MPLTPEQAASLGLPPAPTQDAPARKVLSPEEASALGLPAPAPPADPSEGMSSGDLRMAGIGRGMQNVALNVRDVLGRVPGLGGIRPSEQDWQEFNESSRTLMAAERSTGAKAPVSFLTGDPETDARIKASVESRYGTGRPGAEGSALGETAAVAPVAAGAGKLIGPVVGRLLPRALQVPGVAAVEGATAGGILAGPGNRGEGALVGGTVGAGLGAGAQAVGLASPPAVQPKAAPTGPLARLAEKAAVRATNADRTATRRAFKGNEARRAELGRFMLDEDVALRSPAKMRESVSGIADAAGKEIGSIAQAADRSGAKADLAAAVTAAKASPAVADLNRNTVSRNAYKQITEMLDDQVAQHGGQIPPSVAHDIRMQLDGMATWDQAAPKPVVKAWRAAREAVDAELDKAMASAGVGSEWSAANARFRNARTLTRPDQKGLADIGAERRAGNRLGSPSEKAAAVIGTATAATGNPAALLLPPATVALNRGFFPASARTLDWASRLGPGAPAPADPRLAALIAALRARRSPVDVGLVPAAAEEGGK